MTTDTLTVKFSLTADFQTIQQLRHTLLEPQPQATLSSLLSDTLSTWLSGLGHTDVQLQTTLQASRPQRHHTGPRPPLPVCQAGILSWYDPDADRTNVVGPLGSQAVLDALASPAFSSFRFLADSQTSISLYRRSDGKWYAAKRIKGRLKRRYIGRPENISLVKLNQITRDLLALA
jgi:hypothetical protein